MRGWAATERHVRRPPRFSARPEPIGEHLCLSVCAVEKNITAIVTKLGLREERTHHRRVAAVLPFLDDR
jgi:hypothetical protein